MAGGPEGLGSEEDRRLPDRLVCYQCVIGQCSDPMPKSNGDYCKRRIAATAPATAPSVKMICGTKAKPKPRARLSGSRI